MSQELSEAIVRIVDGGESPSDVLADLHSVDRQKRDGMVTSDDPKEVDLLQFLVETNMVRLTEDGQWRGPLADYVSGLPANDPLAVGWGQLLVYMQVNNRPLPANSKPIFGKLFNALCKRCVILGVDKDTVGWYRNKITGGDVYEHVTENDLVEDAARLVRGRIQERWESEFIDTIEPVTTSGTATVSDIVAALRAAATNLEA